MSLEDLERRCDYDKTEAERQAREPTAPPRALPPITNAAVAHAMDPSGLAFTEFYQNLTDLAGEVLTKVLQSKRSRTPYDLFRLGFFFDTRVLNIYEKYQAATPLERIPLLDPLPEFVRSPLWQTAYCRDCSCALDEGGRAFRETARTRRFVCDVCHEKYDP